jgi:hypothetical protein
MLSWAVWSIGFLLQVVILFRSLRARILTVYPYFFAYMVSVLVGAASICVVWLLGRNSYQSVYWGVQFLTLLVGCGIILEIFKHELSPYRGAEKFATAVGLATFGVVFCFAVAYRFIEPSTNRALFELERNVRTVQALLLFAILVVIAYYRIPTGKNLKGMIAGYGLYIVTSLFTLAIRAYAGPQFNSSWNIIQPLSFDLSLTIWMVALWSFHPNPLPDPAIPLEGDYEALAARTRRALVAMRSHLTRTARP